MMVAAWLHAGCAVACLAWAALVLSTGRGGRAWLPAVACLATAAWAGAVALAPDAPFTGLAGGLETLRTALWLALLLAAGWRMGGAQARPMLRHFAIAGGILVLVALAALMPIEALAGIGSPLVPARLALVLLVVLLAENLFRNVDSDTRWHMVLPCIALGGLATFDVLLYAHAALTRDFSPALANARAVLTALAMPLLAIGAMRDRRWRRDPPVSRQVVFHGATLLVAGSFLMAVGGIGEALRHLGEAWAGVAQVALWGGTVMALAVLGTTRSVRSRLRRRVVDQFFTARYDYRHEWLRCVATLSAPGMAAPLRAIRAIADPADSPGGVLLLREAGEAGLHWAGSWNHAAEGIGLPAGHPLLARLRVDGHVEVFTKAQARELPEGLAPAWLAVPLMHHREGLLGLVLLAPPRAALALDGEVFALLRTLGQEVAMFLAERRGAEQLTEQQRLQDYARRFAFVAHDVKTVASQLTLLLANAEGNIHEPAFQQDMLLTVRAAATRINTLIARLRQPGEVPDDEMPAQGDDEAQATTLPLPRLQALAARQPHPVMVEPQGRVVRRIAMAQDLFDTAVARLLDNAVEASPPAAPVRLLLHDAGPQVVIDIIDRGPGMSAAFIRDGLFRPLATWKPRGDGIGAWQARELVRRAGGTLTVLSRPGAGTTMRLTLPAEPAGSIEARPLVEAGRP